jgi:hypothetical protein
MTRFLALFIDNLAAAVASGVSQSVDARAAASVEPAGGLEACSENA